MESVECYLLFLFYLPRTYKIRLLRKILIYNIRLSNTDISACIITTYKFKASHRMAPNLRTYLTFLFYNEFILFVLIF